MLRHLRIIRVFVAASTQQELAYHANFAISLLNALLKLATGWLGLVIVFEQVDALNGWDYAAALAVLGVYLLVGALRDLVLAPSLNQLAGLEGDIWQGTFDFVLLRPANTQFLVSVRQWQIFAVFDVVMALLVIAAACAQITLTAANLLAFLLLLTGGVITIYAMMLIFSSLLFWSPGFLFTWVFDGIFQMARYPVGIYPGALGLLLTWVIPIGIITTVPAQALTGDISAEMMLATLIFAVVALAVASLLFRRATNRYASASS
ncbi:MAG: hypothetical protein GYB66_07525 [Chloroflexi bacterium]|nr:hypothetical protein [Chloroflexota bacterium]